MFSINSHCGKEDWGDCRRCGLSEFRRRVAIRRDVYPSDIKPAQWRTDRGLESVPRVSSVITPHILFIGEAPGQTEDHLGIPFTGESARVLDFIFSEVQPFSGIITNTVGCRPVTAIENDGGTYDFFDWNRTPTPAEITACKPHIVELLQSYKFHAVVYLGKVATEFKTNKRQTLELMHPTAILREEYPLLISIKEGRKLDLFITELKKP